MTTHQIVYLVFAVVLVVALIFDLGLLNKKNKEVSIKAALQQTMLWVSLALGFFVFMWVEEGQTLALQYLSAYLMEWSLSIDNIFVFILIFSAFSVKEKHYGRVLLIGILMAIVFRIIFITVGVALVDRFEWILYIFGAFLLYTGIKMFTANHDEEFKPQESKIYRFMQRFLPLVPHDGGGKYIIREKGKPVYTTLFVVVIMLAAIDLVFALDSIPAVMGISRDKLVIYTSNIFAVLGLRSLFFLLRGAVSKFDYLQQGIAIVLVFIGIKMLAEHYISMVVSKNIQVAISLGVILVCISGSIFYSIFMKKKGVPKDVEEE
ncbi:MAG TPA: TerC/Alx family metal homeostasis membrane protein [Chitinophagaceae bacterium]|nr:TerC/Alx family metal homeostasis membrane protein [Chitinophagaceae bacterium]MCC6634750.1 TerC/Alx family metal homeostasis membrane protein [Chitinophagaceae bacterium]HMZ46648.1 TerC/Alx family metal homeostasis membrane protein [Chitinophagaceae bacterium]HNE92918.1 TerC/Alx family metal homeostasis membrane protein [Chitinophagaceae bacterium]HNF29426.1 TerC/Alx family metal homeostasis membrane protein [Chitinophagaceae bacterium]